ncbi:unnamed protein product [Caenorhabditis auriculariae]|uniref:Uncharacterized protein n=1 Tax=Caenorhabditis auriculariae TaxID=2777116 RepID=A0A8S1H1P9_9PELO|nr:unnamed protein product [Caenorhabditis auriculariae]
MNRIIILIALLAAVQAEYPDIECRTKPCPHHFVCNPTTQMCGPNVARKRSVRQVIPPDYPLPDYPLPPYPLPDYPLPDPYFDDLM